MSPASLVSYYVSNNIQRMKRMVCSYLQFCSYAYIQRQISKQKFCREWWICLGRISNSFCRYRSNSTIFPLSLPPPSLSSSSSSLTWEWSVSYECTTFLICASHGTHHFLSHSIDLIFSIGLSNTEFMSVSNLNLYPCPRKQLVRWINNNNKKVFQKPPHSKIRQSGTSLVVQQLRFPLPMQGVWVQSLVKELGSHMPHSKKKERNINNRSSIVTNSKKTLKNGPHQNILKNKQARKQRSVYLESTLAEITLI